MLANQEATYPQNGCNRYEKLRWICGKTRKDKIRNESFQVHFGVASIGDKIR